MLPISEHPSTAVGLPDDRLLIADVALRQSDEFKVRDKCHQEGIGVIIDWVPAHFPKDGPRLAYFDARTSTSTRPAPGRAQGWGTYFFNYGRNEVRSSCPTRSSWRTSTT
jgi:1,4-alpha-glucan branching enzyme